MRSGEYRPQDVAREGHGRDPGHGLMMLVCCVPMLVIGIALLASGVTTAGWILVAMSVLMIVAMMGGTSDAER